MSVATEKSPVTPPGIDPETVRLVAQCLNHYATPTPWYSFSLGAESTPGPWYSRTKPFYTFHKRPRLLEQRIYSEQSVLDKGDGGRNKIPKTKNKRRDPE